MGYYIQSPTPTNKATYLVKKYGAEILSGPPAWSDVPPTAAVVVVVDNGLFEAAGLAYNEAELNTFSEPGDPRPKIFMFMDKQTAYNLAGYRPRT